jgi:probable H4MPT-linked C1 transfer pathway protein
MAHVILGLDIGGANLKAATPDGRAEAVPFPLWKQPEKLPAALAELVARFGEVNEFAVTMTGELCDCFETKQQGVAAIVNAVLNVSRSWPVRVWSTDGAFLNSNQAKDQWSKVAAANWHALATYAASYHPEGPGILIDIGSTTTDLIPIFDGQPIAEGKTDYERLLSFELCYTGVRRTPLCAIHGLKGPAELFATTLDVNLLLGFIPENPDDRDTADGRPATRHYAHGRVSRMFGGDATTIPEEYTFSFAEGLFQQQFEWLCHYYESVNQRLRSRHGPAVFHITSGSGEWLARKLSDHHDCIDVYEGDGGVVETISLGDRLGPAVAECAPAYAVAVLAKERPL